MSYRRGRAAMCAAGELLVAMHAPGPAELAETWFQLIGLGVYPAWGGYQGEYAYWELSVSDDDPLAHLGWEDHGRARGYVRLKPGVLDDDRIDSTRRDLLKRALVRRKQPMPVVVFEFKDDLAVGFTIASRDSARTTEVQRITQQPKTWVSALSIWLFPDTDEVLDGIRAVYGDDCVVHPSLRRRLHARPAARQEPVVHDLQVQPPLEAVTEAVDVTELARRLERLHTMLVRIEAQLAALAGAARQEREAQQESSDAVSGGAGPDLQNDLRAVFNRLTALEKTLRSVRDGGPTGAVDTGALLDDFKAAVLPHFDLLQDQIQRTRSNAGVTSARDPHLEDLMKRVEQELQRIKTTSVGDYNPKLIAASDRVLRNLGQAEWMERLRESQRGKQSFQLVSNNSIAILYSTAFESWLSRTILGAVKNTEIDWYQSTQDRVAERKTFTDPARVDAREVRTQLKRWLQSPESVDGRVAAAIETAWTKFNQVRPGLYPSARAFAEDLEASASRVFVLRRQPAHQAEDIDQRSLDELRTLVHRWIRG